MALQNTILARYLLSNFSNIAHFLTESVISQNFPALFISTIFLQDLMASAIAVLVGLQAVPVGITPQVPRKRLL